MSFTKLAFIAGASLAALTANGASAQVVLNFTGISTSSSNSTLIQDFYNGGTSAAGTSGTNYGVTFSSNALAINSYNGSMEPNPGILYFLDGPNVFINYAAGFTNGFAFYYASNSVGTATAFSGLNGTGTALGTFALVNNYSSTCGYCNWQASGVNFAGTARSIGFTGAANYIAFDQVTFGSAQAGGAVPEPASWALMIAGFGAVGVAMRRRQSVKASIRFA